MCRNTRAGDSAKQFESRAYCLANFKAAAAEYLFYPTNVQFCPASGGSGMMCRPNPGRIGENQSTMHRIDQGSAVQQIINHSRFVGFALACADERELRMRLAGIARQHVGAHHLAFAYRLKTGSGLVAHCNDSGEPSGTAGRPILAQMEGFEVLNAVVAVVRYFGGVKLGAGGLIRAYGGTARTALQAAVLVPYVELTEIRLTIAYPDLQPLTYQLGKAGGEILSKAFGENVDLVLRLPAVEAEAFRARFGSG